MASRRVCLLLTVMIVTQAVGEDIRSVEISLMPDCKFQCANTTCLPFINIITSDIKNCQVACLVQSQCRAATFHRSTSGCELFADMLGQDGNMLADADATSMNVISGTRFPPELTTTSTSTTTSTTTTTTTTSSTTTTTTTTTSRTTSTSTTSTTSTTTTTTTTSRTTSTTSTTTTTTTTTTAPPPCSTACCAAAAAVCIICLDDTHNNTITYCYNNTHYGYLYLIPGCSGTLVNYNPTC
ncbi:unnamed protein product [Adineta steineri]|uniref:Apple domain-containing protein n=1 Tax=Adineta steineri TaxID=433720 RepID=A0A818MJM6_9BILA|nr:unnamed protein product [Adineta steineri]CAF3590280.1 unnamed protein product [Adineta steineri]